jgi:hypothetical protein
MENIVSLFINSMRMQLFTVALQKSNMFCLSQVHQDCHMTVLLSLPCLHGMPSLLGTPSLPNLSSLPILPSLPSQSSLPCLSYCLHRRRDKTESWPTLVERQLEVE